MQVDPSVLARLKRLDDKLSVTFSELFLDPETRQPIETVAGGTIFDPHFYLWRKCDDGKTRLVAVYQWFGHEQVARLEQDVFRSVTNGTASVDQVMNLMTTARERYNQSKLTETQQLQADKIFANRHRIHDLVFEGKGMMREAKAFSAPGLLSRSTPGLIVKDAKEDGWELPSEEA